MPAQTGFALVTGGNRGLGEVVVTRLLELGKPVLLAARSVESGEATASKLAGKGEVKVLQLDTSSAASIEAAAKAVAADYNQKIDLLVRLLNKSVLI